MKTVAVLWSLCHFHDRESERIYFSRHQIPEYVNIRGRIRMKNCIALILKAKGDTVSGAHFQKFIHLLFRGQINQNFDIFYFSSILVKYV